MIRLPFILLQAEPIIDKALEVNPWNAGAFGLLVAILITSNIFVWRAWKEEREYSKEVSGKILLLTDKITSGLDEDKLFRSQFNDLSTEIKTGIKLLEGAMRDHYGSKLDQILNEITKKNT